MLSAPLMKLAQKNSWRIRTEEDSVFGEFNGYLFTATEGKGFKSFITSLSGISPEGLNSIMTWLAANSRQLKLRNYETTDNFLCVRLQEGLLPRRVDQIEYFLAQLTGLLDQYGLPQDACAICGRPASKRGLFVGLFCHLHPECQEREGIDFTQPSADVNSVDDAAVMPPDSDSILTLTQSMVRYRDDLTDAVIRICAIPSVKAPAVPGAPFGTETVNALNCFLDMGRTMGMQAVNLDNQVGYVEWGQGDRIIAALCHLDVVPAGEGWQQDPFTPIVQDGRIIARGTADDKGPAIAVLYGMKALIDEGYEPNARIRLIVGLDEESGSACMAHYVRTAELPAAGFTADAAFPVIYAEKGIARFDFICDTAQNPEDALQLIAAQAGARVNMVPAACHLQFAGKDSAQPIPEQIVEGRAAHASLPWEGINAISMAMQEAAGRLSEQQSSHPFVTFYQQAIGLETNGASLGIAAADETGPLTMNAGLLKLDRQQAVLSVDIRYPACCNIAEMHAAMQAKAAAADIRCELVDHTKPLFLAKDSELVGALMKVYNVMTASSADAIAIGGGTYARSMPNIVAFGPTFPGDPDVCHQVNESVSQDRLLAAAAIYREALRALSR